MEDLRKCSELLEKYCNEVHSSMNVLQQRTKRAFERVYSDLDPKSASSSQYNPMSLLYRHEATQAQSVKLSEDVTAQVEVEKRLPQKSLLETHTIVAALLQLVPDDMGHDIDSLRDELEKSQSNLKDKLRTLHTAGMQLREVDQNEEADVVWDIPKTLSTEETLGSSAEKDIAKESQDLSKRSAKLKTTDLSKHSNNPRSGRSKRSSSPASTRAHQSGSGRDARTKNIPVSQEPTGGVSSAPIFVPIQKSAYNRLPLNIRSRAGKLDPLNELYKKTFQALAEKGGPMSDVEIMAATGEPDTGRIEGLRGLALIRNSAHGWELVPKGRR